MVIYLLPDTPQKVRFEYFFCPPYRIFFLEPKTVGNIPKHIANLNQAIP